MPNYRLLSVLALSLLLPPGAGYLGAQSVGSSVQGTVADSSGAVVPDSAVTLRNINTGVVLHATTNSAGQYSFPSLPAGTYSLEVLKDGFGTFSVAQFTLTVAQHGTQDATLGISAAQSITVNGSSSAQLLQPDSNDLGTVIGPQSVAQLPLNGRNFMQLALLSGASQTPSGAASGATGQTGRTGNQSNSITVAGLPPDFTMYLVDGIKTYGSRAGNSSLQLSIGAIDQFEVHYGFFMPDLGPNPGIVDVITKKGTNRFHGEAYEYVRTDQMRAKDYFNAGANPPYHQNQFGGDIGGPIWRDKMFFFGNYEGYRQSQSTFQTALVPTAAMQTGDFSSLLSVRTPVRIVNPRTKVVYANNVIPQGDINPIAKRLLAYYGTPNYTSSNGNNFSGSPHLSFNTDQVTFRSDVNLNEKNQIFGQFSYLNSPYTNPGLFPGQGTSFPLNTELIALGWTRTLGQNKVNELRVGWTRNSVFSRGLTLPGVQTQLGITGTADIDGIPGIGVTGYTGFGTANGQLGDVDNVYQVHDSFSWLHGNHQFKFGGDIDYTRAVNSSANATARGSLNFTGGYTGYGFADFLTGIPTNGESKGMPPTHVRYSLISPYVQDTWRVTPKLTGNFGLAWFGSTPFNTSGADKNLVHSFDFTSGKPTFYALGQTSSQPFRMTRINFAPRVGFAYAPNDKTVIRSGFGFYYTTTMALNLQYAIVSQVITVNNSLTNTTPVPTASLGNGAFPPATVGQITQPQADAITGPIQYLDKDLRSPYVEQWNFDIQRTVGRNYLLDIGYVGNASHHLALNYNPWDCSNPNNVSDLVCRNSNRVYLGKYDYMQAATSQGYGNYNGLIVKFQRQFSNGLSLIANYTWSKGLAVAQQGGIGNLNQRRNCLGCDYGPITSNVPHSFVVSAVYELPFGRGKQFASHTRPLLDAFIGGWRVNLIETLQSGVPFTITAPNKTTWSADQVRADRNCTNHELADVNVRSNNYSWINTSCFAAPANLVETVNGVTTSNPRFGTGGFDYLNGPGVNNTDLGAHKSFTLHDEVKFTVRGEFFNVWNHAQFNAPDSGVASGTFGKITSARSPRLIQLGGVLNF